MLTTIITAIIPILVFSYTRDINMQYRRNYVETTRNICIFILIFTCHIIKFEIGAVPITREVDDGFTATKRVKLYFFNLLEKILKR